MRTYLLPVAGQFYKANLHCHTLLSDGQKTPEEVKEIYKNAGYSVVAYTDHDILIPHPELCDDSFIALNAFEVEPTEPKSPGKELYNLRKTCHICCIALEQDTVTQPCWHRTKYLFGNAVNHRDEVKFDESEPDYERRYSGEGISEMMQIFREKGFFVTYNHPTWSSEQYTEYTNYHGMNAFEMFNGGCLAGGWEEYNPRVYDDILRGGERIYCIGADDNHNTHALDSRKSDSFVAFTMIKAEHLTYRDITKALEAGHFYASEGPQINALYYEDGKVTIECSAADRILMTTDMRAARIAYDDGSAPLIGATFSVPAECRYFRLTVIDKNGKHACTNAYFIDTLN